MDGPSGNLTPNPLLTPGGVCVCLDFSLISHTPAVLHRQTPPPLLLLLFLLLPALQLLPLEGEQRAAGEEAGPSEGEALTF